MAYIQLDYISNMKWMLLEIRLPKNILKTPLAMELVLAALHKTSEGNFFEQKWKGKVVAWFSLEVVSLGGDVHFYIRTTRGLKNLVEAQLYSQFPGIEVLEAEDYVNAVDPKDLRHPNSKLLMYGVEYGLKKPDSYPIKTYVDFKLDTTIRREEEAPYRTDPISSMVEFFATIGKNEQIWFQILVRATGKRFRDPKSWFGGKRDWKSEARDLVAKMQKKGEGEHLSKSETEIISAIEREISKQGFDCGIRSVYIAKSESFNGPVIGALKGLFNQYSSEIFNGFYPVDGTGAEYPFDKYDWSWDLNDFARFGFRSTAKLERKMFNAYVNRGYFYRPYKNLKRPFILNTEELATLYHFPNGIETPGFSTIQSRKAEPPANLPI